MDSFEFNKIAGAVLGTGLLVLGLKNLGGELFHSGKVEKPGYVIEVAEKAPEGGEAVEAAKPLAELLASANVQKGMDKAKACAACHDFTKGGPAKTGPNLWDVIERPIAAAAGFEYSDALKGMAGKNWTYESMDAWLKAPKAFAAGTKMGFGGLKNDQARADVLAYLASLSDAPKPFPTK
jgi:cytochrome c